MTDSAAVLDRLFDKISPEPNSGCWLWTGAVSAGKYGSFSFEGRMQKAHRVTWRLMRGPVPDGLDLDHICRVTICCNPDHLEPVTRSENLRRSPLKNRYADLTHCKRGHEFTPENTMWRKGGTWRACRTCMRMHTRNWRARIRSAA